MTNLHELTLSLGGTWHGHYGTAPCPICQPEGKKTQSALTLTPSPDGRLLAHCKKLGCSFRDLVRALGLASGRYPPPDPAAIARAEAKTRAEAQRRSRKAAQIWAQSQPIPGTPAQTYLRARGLICHLPAKLQFHPAALHGPSGMRLPAMVALVEGGDAPAIHCTWLRPDGLGKADVQPNKTMLGSTKGGGVRLMHGAGPLVVAEGIETALSLACGLLDGAFQLWAALSAPGLRSLRLSTEPDALIIATDGDEPGRSAGFNLAARADALGWKVSFAHAPEGCDWNDILMMKGA